MSIGLIGTSGAGSTQAEVEAATKALRIAHRPIDVGVLGSYGVAVNSGKEAAGASANSPVLAFRWAPSTTSQLCALRRLKFSMAVDDTGFTAGRVQIDFFIARAFSVQDTGGGAVTLTTNNAKWRTSFGTTGVAIQAASTGVLTAGTRTKDANPFHTLITGVGTGTFASVFNDAEVFRASPGEWPLVLANNEGIVIEATVPATGTWRWTAVPEWDELAAY